MTKYKIAAEIVNKCMAYVSSLCVPEASIYSICVAGDAFIEEQCAGVYNKSKPAVEKGIAFPTCVSVNECVCHCSPAIASEEPSGKIKDGDLVKVDLGCHIDGWIAVCAHSLKVGEVRGRYETRRDETRHSVAWRGVGGRQHVGDGDGDDQGDGDEEEEEEWLVRDQEMGQASEMVHTFTSRRVSGSGWRC